MARRIDRERLSALDIVSYGRRGPSRPGRFSPQQIAQISRTIRGAPEVVVKVSGGGHTLGAVAAHFEYISRHGELEIETDGEDRVQGEDAAADLVEDWDLEIDAALDRWDHMAHGGRTAHPKLVHNIVLSMPAGTPPSKLLSASRGFAREEFALQHRYAMVLHTDEDHPHVHLVVSAHNHEGKRLNVRKADLRRWRERFAEQLRKQGLEANATPAQLRGRLSDHQKDGLFRAALRGESRVEWERTQRVAEAASSHTIGTPGLGHIFATAEAVRHDWLQTRETLEHQGLTRLAAEVEGFRRGLRVPKTREERAFTLIRRAREQHMARQMEFVR